jgi:hypothetical protein
MDGSSSAKSLYPPGYGVGLGKTEIAGWAELLAPRGAIERVY